MKKLITLLLTLALILSFAACGGDPAGEPPDDTTTTTTTTTTKPPDPPRPPAHRIDQVTFDNDKYIIAQMREGDGENAVYYIILEKDGAELDRIYERGFRSRRFTADWNDTEWIFLSFGLNPIFTTAAGDDYALEDHYYNSFNLFTVMGEKFQKIEFYEDGKKLDYINYPILTGILSGENSFKTYYADFPGRDWYGEIVFTYNAENFRFDGVSEKLDPEAGSLKIALDLLDKLFDYWFKTHYAHFEMEDHGNWAEDPYFKIIEEGWRTKSEYITSIREIFTEAYADKIFAQLLSEFEIEPGRVRPPVLEERDGLLNHRISDGMGAYFLYGFYIDILSESDTKIETDVYSLFYTDASHGIYAIRGVPEKMIIEKNNNGKWRISSSDMANVI
jgi:predicted small lipoprotein YifL